jgi:hypothetical protein
MFKEFDGLSWLPWMFGAAWGFVSMLVIFPGYIRSWHQTPGSGAILYGVGVGGGALVTCFAAFIEVSDAGTKVGNGTSTLVSLLFSLFLSGAPVAFLGSIVAMAIVAKVARKTP